MREVAAAVLAADWEPSTRPCDLLLDGLALLTHEGYVAAAPALKVALRAFCDEPLSEVDELRWLWLAHPVITTLVVVSTGNHYWLDAIAGAVLVGATLAVTHRERRTDLATAPS